VTAVVSLSGVRRRYRLRAETITAVDDVSLELEPGSIVGLVGPSGSGKTTLINLIVGFDSPEAGTVELPVADRDDWNRIAIIPQDLGLIDDLDLIENIELPARLGNRQPMPTEDVVVALGLAGLERRRPEEMSLGERQRVAVARALVASPALLVADEPTAHQDEANAGRVVELLVDAAHRGSAVLVTTHDRRTLARFDRVLEMSDGRITEAGRSPAGGSR
jgi:ABC-type lipoprotein export system ATPase subunit